MKNYVIIKEHQNLWSYEHRRGVEKVEEEEIDEDPPGLGLLNRIWDYRGREELDLK